MRGARRAGLSSLITLTLAACSVGGVVLVAAPASSRAQSDTTQVLKDRHGRILGSITARADGRQQATDYRGYSVGSYDPRTNRTFDETGKVVGQGNLLSGLIASSPRVLERDKRSMADLPPVELSDLSPPKAYTDPRDGQEALLTSEDRDLALEAIQRAARTPGQSAQEWFNSRSDNRGKFEFEAGELAHPYVGGKRRCRRAVMTVQTRDGVTDRHGQIICWGEVRGRWMVVDAWRL
jgi:hypothetical protein